MAVEFEGVVKKVSTAQKVDSQDGTVTVKLTVTLEADVESKEAELVGALTGLQHKTAPAKVKIG